MIYNIVYYENTSQMGVCKLNYCYDVVLYTGLGAKKGRLDLTITENKIDGSLQIMAGEERVCGQLDDKGGCLLYGRIDTAMHIYDFTACGLIAEESVDLEINIGSDVFSLSGKAAQ